MLELFKWGVDLREEVKHQENPNSHMSYQTKQSPIQTGG